jgi:hypothetical protein
MNPAGAADWIGLDRIGSDIASRVAVVLGMHARMQRTHATHMHIRNTHTQLHHQRRLLEDLLELPPELWKDYVGLVEQELCIRAAGFVGSWPSTYSLFVYNRRLAALVDEQEEEEKKRQQQQQQQRVTHAPAPPVVFFRKLKKTCLDDGAMQQFPHTRHYMPVLRAYGFKLASTLSVQAC